MNCAEKCKGKLKGNGQWTLIEYSFTASFYYTATVYAQDETHSANSGLPVLTLQKDTSESSQWVFFFFNFSTTLHSLKKKDIQFGQEQDMSIESWNKENHKRKQQIS